MNALERVKLAKEIAGIRVIMLETGKSGRDKLRYAKRIAEIRVLLGVVKPALAVDLANPEIAYTKLSDYIINDLEKLPEGLRAAELQIIHKLRALLPNNTDSEYHTVFADALRKYDTPETKLKAYDYFKEKSKYLDLDSQKVKAISEQIEGLKNIKVDIPQDVKQLISRYKMLVAVITKMNSMEEIPSDYEEFYQEHLELHSKIRGWEKEHIDEHNQKIEQLKESLKPIGQKVIEDLLWNSPVEEKDAIEWANAQIIDKAAERQLKKVGYPIEDLRRDLAEFHRLTGGKLRVISFSYREKRANSGSIGTIEGGTMNIGQRFSKTTLFHELAHHLEEDFTARHAANGYLIARRDNETVYSLRSLTGNNGYHKDEGAYKDTFIDPYIGKKYPNEVTEVFSMGVQYLSNPHDAAMLLAKDPELAALITGYLSSEITPAMKALQQAQDVKIVDVRQEQADKEQQEKEIDLRYQACVYKLAAMVNLQQDNDFLDSLSPDTKQRLLRIIGYENAVFVGDWCNMYVFKGKFKNFTTKRYRSGYAVAIFTPQRQWHYNSVRFFISLDEIKACMKIADTMPRDLQDGAYRSLYTIENHLCLNFDMKGMPDTAGKIDFIKRANVILGQPS